MTKRSKRFGFIGGETWVKSSGFSFLFVFLFGEYQKL
nr:MAG TPA: hypothetical protein [Caudoviricetes sp.]